MSQANSERPSSDAEDPAAFPDEACSRHRRPPVITRDTDRSLVDPSAWIAPGAVVVGEVEIGASVGIWFGATARGDTERIVIGPRSNVQEQCVLHCDPGYPCVIESDVTIGHAAIVHGATVEHGALIGIGAIILNGARVGTGAIVAAGALVTENTVIPAGMVAMGSPAKAVKPVSEALAARTSEGAAHYVQLAAQYRKLYENAS